MGQRCVSFAFTTVLLPSLFPLRRSLRRLASRPRRNRNNGRMHALFFSFLFSSSVPFSRLEARERRGKKGWKATPYLRARPSSVLFIPPRFSSATFILFNVEDERRKWVRGKIRGGRGGGGGKEATKKKRCAVASLMITQQKTRTSARS